MKNLFYVVLALVLVYGCASTQNNKRITDDNPEATANDTVRIANDSLYRSARRILLSKLS